MKIRIDGRELLVKKTTRGLVEWQRQSGISMPKMSQLELEGYAPAMAAFFALHNAGLSPVWEDLLDRDVEEFGMVQEPGDVRDSGDASDPASSLAGSVPGGDGASVTERLASKPSSRQKAGLTSK